MKSSVTQLVEFAPALAAVLGGDAVLTERAQLDAYTADTYWPAIAARANGAPLGRPDVVALPRTEEDVAELLRVAAEYGVPVVAWGGGSGTQGGAVPGSALAGLPCWRRSWRRNCVSSSKRAPISNATELSSTASGTSAISPCGISEWTTRAAACRDGCIA